MDRFDRIFDLHKLLSASRYPVPRQKIEQELECSRATAKRIIEAMRLYLNAPIKYDRQLNGYYYDPAEGDMYELPGVWFNSSELHALLTVQQLLTQVQPGLLERQLAPLKSRIDQLLKAQGSGGHQLSQRIQILQSAARPAGPFFQPICAALAQQQCLSINYYQRSQDQTSQRTVSPQRLTYYRDNWYLDAYCHLRQALRTFALDAVKGTEAITADYQVVTVETLTEHYNSTYGIFSGQPLEEAILLFGQTTARWVAQEQWHPKQRGSWLEDGRYQLQIPYSQPQELVMDILRYGDEVEVIAPESLRHQVINKLQNALKLYK